MGEGKRNKECSWVKGKLTAFHFITHVTAVVPAIALQIIADADAGVAGEVAGTSCSPNTGQRQGAEKRGEKEDDDKLSERE